MIVHAYILCFNEEATMPFILDYYSKYCDRIILIDNESTDGSLEVAKRYPKVTVFSWTSNNKYDEFKQTYLKQELYKNYSIGLADWVIVVDGDEVIYGLEDLENLKNNKVLLPNIEGYHMVSRDFPVYDGGCITSKVQYGIRMPHMDKQSVFSPSADIKFGLGMHTFTCETAERNYSFPALKLLHYKYLGLDFWIKRLRTSSGVNNSRLIDSYGDIGSHLRCTDAVVQEEFDSFFTKLKKII